MKKRILYFVFDGLADWEASYALTGIEKSGMYSMKTIGFDKEIKRTMGGMSIVPDLDFIPADLGDIDFNNTAMLILPGGSAWEQKLNWQIVPLVEHCVQENIPVAAICGATIVLADLGFLENIEHTSNDIRYLEAFSPLYQGHALYQYQPCVNAGTLITASGTAALEFADEIFERLGIKNNSQLKEWFDYFRNKPVNFVEWNSR
jgi:putative intracellular protease/amidase